MKDSVARQGMRCSKCIHDSKNYMRRSARPKSTDYEAPRKERNQRHERDMARGLKLRAHKKL
jgi:hypothetical protein